MARKEYVCKNPMCTLGSRKDEGTFTGGITKEQALLLSGDPEAEHGAGVCPNCGELGEET